MCLTFYVCENVNYFRIVCANENISFSFCKLYGLCEKFVGKDTLGHFRGNVRHAVFE